MRFIILLSQILFSAFTLCAQKVEYYYVASENLNIRSGPGKDYPIVSSLKYGDSVLVKSIELGWASLTINDKVIGYSAANYLSREKNIQHTNTIKDDSFSIGDVFSLALLCVALYLGYRVLKFLGVIGLINALSELSSSNSNKRASNNSSNTKPQSINSQQYYYCKYCGTRASSIFMLTANNCRNHPKGTNKGKHVPY